MKDLTDIVRSARREVETGKANGFYTAIAQQADDLAGAHLGPAAGARDQLLRKGLWGSHGSAQSLITTFMALMIGPHNAFSALMWASVSAAPAPLELEEILRLAEQHDAYVITDEPYEHIVFAPHEHVYATALPGAAERVITCNSLSKTYSITGWRLGYAAAAPGIRSPALPAPTHAGKRAGGRPLPGGNQMSSPMPSMTYAPQPVVRTSWP